MAVTTESMVYHIQPTTVTILSQGALGQLGSEAIIVTDYTEVELGSNEVAEESVGRCADPRDQAAAEEEMMTVSQHVDLPKDAESSRNSEEEGNLCEKSTQCDINNSSSVSMSALKANEIESNKERKNKELQERKKDVTQTSACLKDDREPNIASNKENSLQLASKDQAVPKKRGRGRPRKTQVAPKVVQNGRRGRTLKAEKDAEKE